MNHKIPLVPTENFIGPTKLAFPCPPQHTPATRFPPDSTRQPARFDDEHAVSGASNIGEPVQRGYGI